MHHWIKNIIGLLLLMLVISCKSYHPEGIITRLDVGKEIAYNNYFNSNETDYVYKTAIDIYGNKLGGIIVIKKISDTIHRVVFTTEFGNKLLDFEISQTTSKLNFVVEELNKKMVLKTFQEDFRLLLKPNFEVSAVYENEESFIYQSDVDHGFYYLHKNKKQERITQLVKTSKRKEKVSYLFKSKRVGLSHKIMIRHSDIKLLIQMKYIGNPIK